MRSLVVGLSWLRNDLKFGSDDDEDETSLRGDFSP